MQSWKRFIATHAEVILTERRSPTRLEDEMPLRNAPARRAALQSFWQREYWDTFMRDEEQERTAIRYIESNPLKAKLCRTAQEWPLGSAKFRDKFHRLLIPIGTPAFSTA
jgi:hypothetical protein